MRTTSTLGVVLAISLLTAASLSACGSDDGGGDGNAGGASGTQGADGSAASAAHGGTTINMEGGTGMDVTASGDGFDEVCAATVSQAVFKPANLLFVVDRSGSMNCNPPPTTTTEQCEQTPIKTNPAELSKWEITRDALKAAVQSLEGIVPLPSVGIMYFNSDDNCGFPTAPSVSVVQLSGTAASDPQLLAFNTSLDGVTPKGDTPIVGVMYGAYTYLQSATLQGNKFIILLTDGAETCDPPNKPALLQWAADATLINIRTFVLGAPGSEGERSFLSQIAYNGGTAASATCDHSGSSADKGDCHMDMTLPGTDFKTELTKNLAAINAQALLCEFDVPKPEPGQTGVDYSKVNVEYTSGSNPPETIPQDTAHPCDSATNKGWQYTAGNTKIKLCGAACDKVKSDPMAKVSIAMGCHDTEIAK
ncbi:MAG: VWA domain-containing protein [Deltaproteobacteria bacterium]|nr:VWA domain-containing protein [Deltaproteobacteria bacterium]